MIEGDARTTLTVAEIASRLNVSAKLVYRLVERNEIPHLRLSTRILIPAEAFDRWLIDASNEGKRLSKP